jgi:hypothetical protein
MSSLKDNVTSKPNATSTATSAIVNTTEKEFQHHMDHKRLEAQVKRNAAQRETAIALQHLADQTQSHIQKLQERVLYDEIRVQTGAVSSQKLNFTDSSTHVNTFNPPDINVDVLPTERNPDCPQISKLICAAQEGIFSPQMVKWILSNSQLIETFSEHAAEKSSSALNNWATIDSVTSDGPPPLIPYLHNKSLSHPSICKEGTCLDNVSPVSVGTNNVEVVDLTDASDDNACVRSKKRYKSTTIEVNLRVKMPGNTHPVVKNYQFDVASNGSNVPDTK